MTDLATCALCGAFWDENHEQGRCGVADATQRILSPPPRDERSFDDAMLDALTLAVARVGGPTLYGDGRNPDWEGIKKWLQAHLDGPLDGITRGRHYPDGQR